MYLILQSTYTEIELALFDSNKIIRKQSIDKQEATAMLIPTIDAILKDNNIEITNLDFIGINQGPAPFTTLRVLISTVNGLAFATGIPLVGTDGLKALMQESNNPKSIVLLNAFSKDVYYSINNEVGCKNINNLLEELKPASGMYFIGNGSILYKDAILEKFPDATISEDLKYCSLETIAKNCLERFDKKEGISQKLMPMYLKNAV
jgi:tRNA threonylcarbamoyladenosine biosynthesis protein TsaB